MPTARRIQTISVKPTRRRQLIVAIATRCALIPRPCARWVRAVATLVRVDAQVRRLPVAAACAWTPRVTQTTAATALRPVVREKPAKTVRANAVRAHIVLRASRVRGGSVAQRDKSTVTVRAKRAVQAALESRAAVMAVAARVAPAVS